MIIPHSQKAINIIQELQFEMNNKRNDGWTTSDMKNRLWQIKMAVDSALVDAPVHVNEPAYEDMYMINRIKGKV